MQMTSDIPYTFLPFRCLSPLLRFPSTYAFPLVAKVQQQNLLKVSQINFDSDVTIFSQDHSRFVAVRLSCNSQIDGSGPRIEALSVRITAQGFRDPVSDGKKFKCQKNVWGK